MGLMDLPRGMRHTAARSRTPTMDTLHAALDKADEEYEAELRRANEIIQRAVAKRDKAHDDARAMAFGKKAEKERA